MGSFEYFDHAADVGIRIRGESLPDLFVAGAQALMEWIGPAPASPESVRENAQVEAETLDELLVRWLQEVLFIFQQRHAYITGAETLDIRGCRLKAVLTARVWDAAQGEKYQEIKAVTYHKLELSRDGPGWRASVILDL